MKKKQVEKAVGAELVAEEVVSKESINQPLEQIVMQNNQAKKDASSLYLSDTALQYLRTQGFDEETIQQAIQVYELEQMALASEPSSSEQNPLEQNVSQRLSLEDYLKLRKDFEIANGKMKSTAPRILWDYSIYGVLLGTGSGLIGGAIYGTLEGISRGLGSDSALSGFLAGLFFAAAGGLVGFDLGGIADLFTSKKRKAAFEKKKAEELSTATAELEKISKEISLYNKDAVVGDIAVFKNDNLLEIGYIVNKGGGTYAIERATGARNIIYPQELLLCVLQPTSEKLTSEQLSALPLETPLLVVQRDNPLKYGFLRESLQDYFEIALFQKYRGEMRYSCQDLKEGKITVLVLKPERKR